MLHAGCTLQLFTVTFAHICTFACLAHQLLQFNDRPLFILLNPTVSDNAKELPLSVYEEDVHVVDKETIKEFVKTSFKIHSDEVTWPPGLLSSGLA